MGSGNICSVNARVLIANSLSRILCLNPGTEGLIIVNYDYKFPFFPERI